MSKTTEPKPDNRTGAQRHDRHTNQPVFALEQVANEKGNSAEETDARAAEFDYANMLGWPVTRTGAQLVAATGRSLLAVQLPAELGQAVQHLLRLRMQDGPVITPPGSPGTWVFLTAPHPGAPEQVPRRLDRPEVQVLIDQLVLLPPSRTADGSARWLIPPSLTCPWLPPVTALATALTLTNGAPQP